MNFIAIIPARFKSRRFPGKPLADINGKPMVVRVMEQVQASGANRVIIATDYQEIVEVVKRAGGEAYLTSIDHQSGTERLQEVIDYYNFPNNQIIVNVQGDEPLISPQIVCQVATNLIEVETSMTTLAAPITIIDELCNPNIVKVVVDIRGYALYFSRANIPWVREGLNSNSKCFTNSLLLRHIGIYAYHADFIRRYVNWSTSPLEQIEMLEQLRVLWYGEKIHVALACDISGIEVNTPEELEQVRLLQQQLHSTSS